MSTPIYVVTCRLNSRLADAGPDGNAAAPGTADLLNSEAFTYAGNDLISLLSQYDNDNVTMNINGMTIDVAAVTVERGNLVLTPQLAGTADDHGTDIVSIDAEDGIMVSQELLTVLTTSCTRHGSWSVKQRSGSPSTDSRET